MNYHVIMSVLEKHDTLSMDDACDRIRLATAMSKRMAGFEYTPGFYSKPGKAAKELSLLLAIEGEGDEEAELLAHQLHNASTPDYINPALCMLDELTEGKCPEGTEWDVVRDTLGLFQKRTRGQ